MGQLCRALDLIASKLTMVCLGSGEERWRQTEQVRAFANQDNTVLVKQNLQTTDQSAKHPRFAHLFRCSSHPITGRNLAAIGSDACRSLDRSIQCLDVKANSNSRQFRQRSTMLLPCSGA
jgi:hypothetical protein